MKTHHLNQRWNQRGLLTSLLLTAVLTVSSPALDARKDQFFKLPGEDTKPPRVVSTKPASGTTGVGVNSQITVTFDRKMDPRTLTGQTITLQRTGDPAVVPGRIVVAGGWFLKKTTVTFAPNNPLNPGSSYTITVSKEVKDLAGIRMSANHESRFTTERLEIAPFPPADVPSGAVTIVPTGPPTGPQLIQDGTREKLKFLQIAGNPSGDAVAVWLRLQGSSSCSIWASRYSPTSGWGEPERLTEEQVECYHAPQVLMYANGDALVMWTTTYVSDGRDGWGRGTRLQTMREAEFHQGQGWNQGRPATMFVDEIVSDSSGDNAIRVFAERPHRVPGLPNPQVLVSLYTPQSGWGLQRVIYRVSDLHDEYVGLTRVAINSSGRAGVFWGEVRRRPEDGSLEGGRGLVAKRFDPESGWERQETVISTNPFFWNGWLDHRVGMDNLGRTIVVWKYPRGINVKRFDPTSGWEKESTELTDLNGEIYNLAFSMGAAGGAIVTWYEWRPTGLSRPLTPRIMARVFTPVSGWEDRMLIREKTGEWSPTNPSVSMSPSGKAVVSWKDSTGPGRTSQETTWVRFFLPDSGWQEPRKISREDAVRSCQYRLVPVSYIDSSGKTIVIWCEADNQGNESIWAAHLE